MPTLRIAKDLDDHMHFVSITTLEWINVFTKEEYFEILGNCLDFLQKEQRSLSA